MKQIIEECAKEINEILERHGCGMFTALKMGNAETPLTEIAGLPIVIKIGMKNGNTEAGRNGSGVIDRSLQVG